MTKPRWIAMRSMPRFTTVAAADSGVALEFLTVGLLPSEQLFPIGRSEIGGKIDLHSYGE